MTANAEAMSLMASLVLEDGRRWGDVALPFQWDAARAILDPSTPPYRWESRPRGGSKTTDAAGWLIVKLVASLPPGSECHAYARDLDQARRVRNFLNGFVLRTPGLAAALTVDRNRVTSATGSTLDIESSDGASAYGIKPAFVLVDELCEWPGTENSKNLWTGITTSMGKVAGAKLAVITTSGDPGSWTHRIYQQAKRSKLWTVADTPGPLPWTDPVWLADQRDARLPSVYARLFMNEWCSPENRLTTIDDVHACVTLAGPLEPIPGQRYVLGVDLSIVTDRTAVSVMHAEQVKDADGREVVQRYVLDRLEVWKPSKANPIDFGAVEAWIVEAAKRYRAHVVADPFQAAAMVQRIRARGVSIDTVNFTPQSNNRMAIALHTTIRSHRLAIPDDPELVAELVNMRLVETSPNQFKLDHDPDKHNDMGTALSLALLTLTQAPPPSGGAYFFGQDDSTFDALGRPLMPLLGTFAGDSAMPASVTIDDEDDPEDRPNGRTAVSPFR